MNVYIKLVESYLSNLKQKNKQYSFRRFIIGLLTGWIGETTNFDHRETNHASSTNLYLTIRIHFHRLPSLFQKVIEHVVLQLLNNDNVVNNSNSGEHYYIDHLSAHEHVYLVLGLLKEAFYLASSHFNSTSFTSKELELDVNSQSIVSTQESSKSFDPAIEVTSLDRLQLGCTYNLRGVCNSKSRIQFSNKRYFQFDLCDESGSVKVQCSAALVDLLFNVVEDGKVYLIRDASLSEYKSGKLWKKRVEIERQDQISKIKVFCFQLF